MGKIVGKMREERYVICSTSTKMGGVQKGFLKPLKIWNEYGVLVMTEDLNPLFPEITLTT